MNEQTNTNEQATESNEAATETTASELPAKMGDVKKRYFRPAEMGEAVQYVGHLNNICGADNLRYNFDPNTEQVPEGWGLFTLPVATKDDTTKQTVITHIVIAKVPSLDAVMDHAKGIEFMEDAMLGEFQTKLGNATRGKDGGGNVPVSMLDFITRRSRGESLKPFNDMADGFVKALKESGLKRMNKKLLRMCLTSQAYAEGQFSRMNAKHWETILDVMIKRGDDAGVNTELFAHWRKTRDQVAAPTTDDDFDLEKLEDLFGMPHEEGGDEPAVA